jgi:hypothetical protein
MTSDPGRVAPDELTLRFDRLQMRPNNISGETPWLKR